MSTQPHQTAQPHQTTPADQCPQPTIAQVMARLGALRDAARAGDRDAYTTARAAAHALGVTDAQIRDAYSRGLNRRMTLDRHLPGTVDFDWQGDPL